MLSHQDRALIKNVQITDGIRFSGPQGFIRTRAITFSVGTQGPFTHILDFADYNPANIEAAYEKEVTTLRAAGVALE